MEANKTKSVTQDNVVENDTSVPEGGKASDVFTATYAYLEGLAVEREAWEETAFRQSNAKLYELLASCYEFYGMLAQDTAKGKAMRLALLDYINCKGLRFTKSTHELTQIVKCVFGVDRRRVSVYSIVLRSALAQKIAADDVPDFIARNGGVEEIRLAKAPNAMTAKQKANSARQFIADAELGVASGPRLQEVLDPAKADADCVAIVTPQANGTLLVRALVYSDGVLNAALAAHYCANKDVVISDTKQRVAANDERRRDDLINQAA
jgi:hypothetical protein